MIAGGRAHVERFSEGGLPPAPRNVLVDQHQQTRLLQRTGEHELDIGGADIACH